MTDEVTQPKHEPVWISAEPRRESRPLPASVTRADRQRMLDAHPLLKEAAEAWARRGEPK